MNYLEMNRHIESIGPLQYRVAGHLPVNDWVDVLGLDTDGLKVSTIGGFVTGLLGRPPKKGDKTNLNNITFAVEKVRQNSIESVIIRVGPI